MKPAFVIATALVALAAPATAQTPPDSTAPVEGIDFRIYREDGSPVSLGQVLFALDGAEVLLVGEEHGNRVGHRLEAMLLAGALERYRETRRWVTLSLEMFERDVQYMLDEYLAGLITEQHFLDGARPWEDYDIRYRPLVEMARVAGAPVIAANAPRRYVNRVTREGPASLEALGSLAKFYLPPLPYPGPSEEYRSQWNAIMAQAMEAMADSASGHSTPDTARAYAGSEGALQAQALWDAAMGHAIAQALSEVPERVVLHFAGSFHVERGTGIPERIQDYRPGTRVVTVVMTQVDDETPLDWDAASHGGLADFVILTR
jgi:uncharacterized iron-regulated protein